MKKLFSLATFSKGLLLALVLFTSVTSAAFAGTVGHRFEMQLPDGSKVEIKGAIMHTIYIDESNNDSQVREYVNDVCKYEASDRLTGGMHCTTSSSCDLASWQSPLLPSDFTSKYQSLTGSNFNDLISRFGLNYEPSRIRGFDGAYWEGSVAGVFNGTPDGFKIVGYQRPTDEPAIASYSQGRKDTLNRLWKSMSGASNDWNIAGTNNKEMLFDNVGGNSLHGNVTWTLKTPTAPTGGGNSPTAGISVSSGVCGNQPGKYPTGVAIDIAAETLNDSVAEKVTVYLSKIEGTKLVDWRTTTGCPADKIEGSNGTFCNIGTVNGAVLNLKWTPPTAGRYGFTVNANNAGKVCSGNPSCPNFNTGQGIDSIAGICVGIIDCGPNDFKMIDVVDAGLCQTSTITCGQKITASNQSCGTGLVQLTTDAGLGDYCGKLQYSTACKSINSAGEATTACCEAPPTAGPMCVSIAMKRAGTDTVVSPVDLKIGDSVKFSCGDVGLPPSSVKYDFRIFELDSTKQAMYPGSPKQLPASGLGSRDSLNYKIEYAGTFVAQCTFCTCPTGAITSCSSAQLSCVPFEQRDYGVSSQTQPTPVPAPATPVPAPLCPSTGQCETQTSDLDAVMSVLGMSVNSSYRCGDPTKSCYTK